MHLESTVPEVCNTSARKVFRLYIGSYRFERKFQHSKSERLKFVSKEKQNNDSNKHRDDQNNVKERKGSKDKNSIVDAIDYAIKNVIN